MTIPTPGEAVSATDPKRVWFAWSHKYPDRATDPLACYEFGVHIGQQLAIERTAAWAGLVPLLQDVLDHLTDLAIERVAAHMEAEAQAEATRAG